MKPYKKQNKIVLGSTYPTLKDFISTYSKDILSIDRILHRTDGRVEILYTTTKHMDVWC